jgi:hypothetical protein
VKGLIAAALVLVLSGASVAAHAEGPKGTLDTLLDRFAKSPGLQASFVEEKQIALLAMPLRSEGVVHYSPHRGLVRHATKPSRESVLVNDKEIVYWNGKDTKRIPLGASAVVGTLARAFALLLAADRAGLEKDFALTLRPAENEAFRIVLEPKSAEVKKVISGIELEGRNIELSVLRVRETNGDVSTTRFSAVDVSKKYTDAELARVFTLPPSP